MFGDISDPQLIALIPVKLPPNAISGGDDAVCTWRMRSVIHA
jgi:hypothetical protein